MDVTSGPVATSSSSPCAVARRRAAATSWPGASRSPRPAKPAARARPAHSRATARIRTKARVA
eukprot:7351282-Prymnesium_polylepis.1